MVTKGNFWHQRHLEPKRKFRWVATIGQGNKLFTYLVKTVNKPTFTTAVGEHKILGHTFKYPGPVTWSDLELEFIGWNDFEVNSLIFIEWPERVHRVYKSSDIMIDFDLDIEGRKVKIKSMSSKGISLIKNIESEIKLQKNIIIL